MPTPEEGYGGGDSPVYDITGAWRRLADMPGGADFITSDSLWLPDGRIAVFRWDYGAEDPAAPEVVAYDPATNSWDLVTFAVEHPFIGTDQSFVLANDGRVYTFDYRIEIAEDEWTVEPHALITESDVWVGSNLAADADGLVYRRAQDTSGSETQLIIHDLSDESADRSASAQERLELVHADPAGGLVIVGGDVEVTLVSYDPIADRWSPTIQTSTPGIDPWHIAIGPDGDLYAPSFYPDFPGLFAISPADGRVRSVQLPDGVTSWDVELLWDDDGQLYAFGNDEAWVFTPDR